MAPPAPTKARRLRPTRSRCQRRRSSHVPCATFVARLFASTPATANTFVTSTRKRRPSRSRFALAVCATCAANYAAAAASKVTWRSTRIRRVWHVRTAVSSSHLSRCSRATSRCATRRSDRSIASCAIALSSAPTTCARTCAINTSQNCCAARAKASRRRRHPGPARGRRRSCSGAVSAIPRSRTRNRWTSTCTSEWRPRTVAAPRRSCPSARRCSGASNAIRPSRSATTWRCTSATCTTSSSRSASVRRPSARTSAIGASDASLAYAVATTTVRACTAACSSPSFASCAITAGWRSKTACSTLSTAPSCGTSRPAICVGARLTRTRSSSSTCTTCTSTTCRSCASCAIGASSRCASCTSTSSRATPRYGRSSAITARTRRCARIRWRCTYAAVIWVRSRSSATCARRPSRSQATCASTASFTRVTGWRRWKRRRLWSRIRRWSNWKTEVTAVFERRPSVRLICIGCVGVWFASVSAEEVYWNAFLNSCRYENRAQTAFDDGSPELASNSMTYSRPTSVYVRSSDRCEWDACKNYRDAFFSRALKIPDFS